MANIMNYFQMSGWASNLGTGAYGLAAVGFFLLIIWTLIWKGTALWKAGRLGQKYWFVAMLIINTVGILEIIYIFCVARKKEKAQKQV